MNESLAEVSLPQRGTRPLEKRRLLHVDSFRGMIDKVVVPAALAVAKNLPAVTKNPMTSWL